MIKDIVEALLESQRMVQQALGNDTANMTNEQRMRYMTEMAFSLCDEVHEAMGETGWKTWTTSNHINHEEFRDEMTDAWLFFMNLMLAVGMTGNELIERTARKQNNAMVRAANAYDGRTTKCPKCKRAFDNEAVKCTVDRCAYNPDTQPDRSIVRA